MRALIDRVISVDPGLKKCGVAVVSARDGVLAKAVIPVTDLSDLLMQWIKEYNPEALLIGGGTASRHANEIAERINITRHTVDERFTTERARERYFQDNPPRGIKKLVPRGLLVPPVPYDDYAAVIIAEQFLREYSERTL